MKTNQQTQPTLVFRQEVSTAMARPKAQLQQDYERAYPALREIIHLVLEEEETHAWEMSIFPHLLLPDLVEAHVANLNLQAVVTKHEDVFALHHLDEIGSLTPAFALCGS